MSRVFRHRLRVRYGECDPQGIVFNANYLAYVDVALTELWREAFGSYDAVRELGWDVVVAEATARFRGAARFDEEVDVALTIARLGETSMTSDLEVRRDGEVLVEGRVVHVWVGVDDFAKRPIPDVARERLAQFSDGSGGIRASSA